MIRTVKELAAAIESHGPTIEDVSRTIYKGTDCGAWVALADDERTQQETWTARIAPSIRGPVVHSVRQARRRRLSPELAPAEVREYLHLTDPERPGHMQDFSNDELAALQREDGADTRTVTRRGRLVFITFDVQRKFAIREAAIRIGSIVEGVDQCTETHTLVFPFERQAFWDAVEAVDKEAGEIWDATHGCDDCGPEDEETGARPINPKCKGCGGEGAII